LRSYRKPIFTLCGEVLIPFSEDNFLKCCFCIFIPPYNLLSSNQ